MPQYVVQMAIVVAQPAGNRSGVMRFNILSLAFFHFCIDFCSSYSTKGVEDLVRRTLPNHVHDFSFKLVNGSVAVSNSTTKANDHFVVSNGVDGTISVEGNTPIALASGYVSQYDLLVRV